MPVNDESAGRRADDDAVRENVDGSVGVGTDGSLVSEVDRREDDEVGVGTDGSLVTHHHRADDRPNHDDDDRRGHEVP